MNRTTTDVLAAAGNAAPVDTADFLAGASVVGSGPWTGMALATVLAMVALGMFLWFMARGERWDQRRPRVWQRKASQGLARRETDFLEATDHGPFRQKSTRP